MHVIAFAETIIGNVNHLRKFENLHYSCEVKVSGGSSNLLIGNKRLTVRIISWMEFKKLRSWKWQG
jgi:hypothetical protein